MSTTLLFLSLSLCSCAKQQSSIELQPTRAETKQIELASDDPLLKIATGAIGDREGAVLVIDPQTGRLRAVVNSRVAFEQTYPPGSAIKPFTALAAMRAGLLERETKHQCRTRYARDGFEIVCAHPKSATPFNLSQALAYSCNDYFANVGERLSEGAFNSTLSNFGFGARTGVNAAEAVGSLLRGEWRVEAALGDSDRLLVTPIQMLAAYAALANGGHLYRPQQSADPTLVPSETARLAIAPEQRAVLIEGMRGAVKYGTAGKTGIGDLPFYSFGKTGTSTASNGFRTQGWFIGFAADKVAIGAPKPEQVKLGVLVFLRRAHGSQAAELARPILEYGMSRGQEDKETRRQGDVRNPQSAIRNPQLIRVRSVRENTTRELPLEEYLVGVVSTEASIETESEALKAQAVISRTYALNNLKRHASEGFDFCSTTHCQQFLAPNERTRAAFREAVMATAGETLRDPSGKRAEVYFSSACGGVTANIETLWGGPLPAPAHLGGVRDDFCAAMPNRRWNQTIPAGQLLKALQSDERTNVGARLTALVVSKRDATGRAETITLEGERRRVVRGWDFKIIVGRALGWQMIKSSRFDVARAGDAFLFRGSGFGHGLGLCQNGAHVMAKRGMNYRRILQFYFPGAKLGADAERNYGTDGKRGTYGNNGTHGKIELALKVLLRVPLFPYVPRFIRLAKVGASDVDGFVATDPESEKTMRKTISSQHFRVSYSNAREIEVALRTLESAREDLVNRLEKASLRIVENAPFEIVVHATTAEFIAATGQSGWAAGVTRGRTIELQPLTLLRKRGILETTLKHELAHAFIETLSGGRAPRWLSEGLAIHVAGETTLVMRAKVHHDDSREELERKLAKPASVKEMRELYAAATREVRALIQSEGEVGVWKRVAKYKQSSMM